MTAIGAPASAAGRASGTMSASPKDSSSAGSAAGPMASASERSAGLASTKTARTALGGRQLGHRLAQADRTAGLPGRVEAQVALGEEQHDGRAEHEAAHLLALLQRHLAVAVVPFANAPH